MFSYMWTSILVNIIISIIIIIIGHYLWVYLLETYSDKVTKDILGSQTQKYKAIIDELQRTQQYESCMTEPNDIFIDDLILNRNQHVEDLPIEDLPIEDLPIEDLAKDLEDFLQNNFDENK